MPHQTIEVHVGQVDPTERMQVLAGMTGPGLVPTLTFNVTSPGEYGQPITTVVLYLWGNAGKVDDILEAIIDNARELRRGLYAKAAADIHPEDKCAAGPIFLPNDGDNTVRTQCATHHGSVFNHGLQTCEAYREAMHKLASV